MNRSTNTAENHVRTAGHRCTGRTPLLAVGAWISLGALVALAALLPDPLMVNTDSPVTVVGIAVLSYLAAAVAGRRWMGWVAAGALAVLVVLGAVVGAPTLALFAVVGVVLMAIGLWIRPRQSWPQAVAVVGFLGAGVVATLLDPRLGLAVAGLGLASHTVWDILHFRRDTVVSRSLALWCIGLDLVLGLTSLAVAVLL